MESEKGSSVDFFLEDEEETGRLDPAFLSSFESVNPPFFSSLRFDFFGLVALGEIRSLPSLLEALFLGVLGLAGCVGESGSSFTGAFCPSSLTLAL
jgi:hypothetical protein